MTFIRNLLLLLVAHFVAGAMHDATAHAEPVHSLDELQRRLETVEPGDAIELAPGNYRLGGKISIRRPGLPGRPIVLRGARNGRTRIESDTSVAFGVQAADWIIERLEIVGVCAEDSDCEHAFQISGAADRTVVRDNRLFNFNAQIKGNASAAGRFPDDILIERNTIANRAPRQTDNPVTLIDVNGGRRWVLRQNLIADFAKAGGDQVSYGAFLKSNSSDGVFEGNVVVCSWRHHGGTRVGLSFGGGGGSNPKACQGGDCSIGHSRGIMRSNYIAQCSDVGIYLNKARDTLLVGNTLVETGGIDVRFPESSASVLANIVAGGRIRSRDRGTYIEAQNLSGPIDLLFQKSQDGYALKRGAARPVRVDPPPDVLGHDVCGRQRNPAQTLPGAVDDSAAGPGCRPLGRLKSLALP